MYLNTMDLPNTDRKCLQIKRIKNLFKESIQIAPGNQVALMN